MKTATGYKTRVESDTDVLLSNGGQRSISDIINTASFTLGATAIKNGSTTTTITGPFTVSTDMLESKAFSVQRSSAAEIVKHWIDDSNYYIKYINDELSSNIKLIIQNTGTEGGNEANATTKTLTISSTLGIYPETSNTGSLGTSSYKWASLYANTLNGNLAKKFTVLGVDFNNYSDATVYPSDLAKQASSATSAITDTTELFTSDCSGPFSSYSNTVYKRPASSIWSYMQANILKGNSTTTPYTGTLYFKDTNVLHLCSNDKDLNIWTVSGAGNSSWAETYGFTLKYMGTGSGNNNTLNLYAHNQSGDKILAAKVTQTGAITFNSTPIVGNTYISLANHTHPTSIATTTDISSITLSPDTKYKLTTGGTSTVFTTAPNTWRKVSVKGTSIGSNALNLVAGTGITLTNDSGTVTIGTTGLATSGHTHGNVSNDGKIGSTKGRMIITGDSGKLEASDRFSVTATNSYGTISISDTLFDIAGGSNGMKINLSTTGNINLSGGSLTNGANNNIFSDNYNNGVHYLTITNAAWKASTAYAVDDTVYYSTNNRFYRCKTAHTSGTTFSSTNWDTGTIYLTATCTQLGSTLKEGTVIAFKIPYTIGSSANYLKLTIGGNTVVSNQLYFNTEALRTHYGAGNIVTFIYDGSVWKHADYGTNLSAVYVYSRYNGETVGTGGLYNNNLALKTSDDKIVSICTTYTTGTSKTCSTQNFIIGSEIFYYTGGAISAGTTMNGSHTLYTQYELLDFRYSSNCGTTLTGGKPIYLVGTRVNGQYFKLDTTKWWTQTLPTTEDGKIYVKLGGAYDTYRITLYPHQDWLEYKRGGIVQCQMHSADTIYYSASDASSTKLTTAGDYKICIEKTTHSGTDANTIYFVT